MTAGVIAPQVTAAAPGGVRLGSLLLRGRIDEGVYGRRGVVAAEALGAPETPLADRRAIVRCAPVASDSPATLVRAQLVAASLRGLSHPSLAPILECAVAGSVAYAAEPVPSGDRLAERLRTTGKLPAIAVRRVVDEIAAGLAVVQAAGLTHGRVNPGSIWLLAEGRAVLGAFSVVHPVVPATDDSWRAPEDGSGELGPAADQFGLALTAATALAGEFPNRRNGTLEALPGVPAAVVAVLARALATAPGDRFPSIAAFAQAFAESIALAGEDLIAGVWEALSRDDQAMAAIMLEMALGFAPDHRDVAILRVRMNGGGATGLGSAATALGSLPGLEIFAAGAAAPAATAMTPEEAIAALLTPPIPTVPARPKNNPWVLFAAGTFACIVLFVLLVALTLSFT